MCFVVCWHTNFMSVGLASRCVRRVWLLLGPMFLIGSGVAPANTLHHSTRGLEGDGDGDGETATTRLESVRVATATFLPPRPPAILPSAGRPSAVLFLCGWSALPRPAYRPLRPRRLQPHSPPHEPTRRPPAQVPPTLQMPPPLQDFRCGALICPHSQSSRTISDFNVILF